MRKANEKLAGAVKTQVEEYERRTGFDLSILFPIVVPLIQSLLEQCFMRSGRTAQQFGKDLARTRGRLTLAQRFAINNAIYNFRDEDGNRIPWNRKNDVFDVIVGTLSASDDDQIVGLMVELEPEIEAIRYDI